MAYLKKSLAILLAFVMVFSTVSVAASAVTGNELSLKIVMYRKDGDNWVETTRAKPGEELKARFFIGTDYYSQTSMIVIAWDNQFFSTAYPKCTKFTSGITTNTSYVTGDNQTISLSSANGNMQYCAPDASKPDNIEFKNHVFKFAEKYNYLPAGYVASHDFLATQVSANIQKNYKWNINEWAIEWDFTVNDNDYVRNSPELEGKIEVPEGIVPNVAKYQEITMGPDEDFLFDVPKGEANGYASDVLIMSEYTASVTTTPTTISVFSNIVLDANGGTFAGASKTKTISGVIGDNVTTLFETANTPTNSGKQFMGWSLTANGDVLSASEIAELKYDYTDGKLYAIWSDEVRESSWQYEIYKMALVDKGDGTYEGSYLLTPDYRSSSATVPVSTPVSIPEDALSYSGFTLDTEKSTLSATTTADGNTLVLKAYLKRDTHTVKYCNEDGSAIDTFTAYYGQPTPTLSADKVPSKAGHTFSWSPALPATVGTSDLETKATFTAEKYLLTFDAGDGKFADDTRIKSLEFNYGEKGEAISDIPTLTGYKFSHWQTVSEDGIPEKVVETVALHAVYTPIDYKITFTVNNSTENAPAAITGKHVDDIVTLPDLPTVTGYTVTGWNYGDATYVAGKGFKMPAADVTMNAVTTANTYSVSFDTQGGNYIAAENHTYGEQISSFPTPTRDGYTFVGWKIDNAAVKYPYTMPANGVLLVAEWSKNPAAKATLKYEFTGTVPAGAVALLPASSSETVGEAVDLAAVPEFSGYEFHGWFYNNRLCQSIVMPAGGATVTGYWTEKTTQAKTGTVTFYKDGAYYDSTSGTVGTPVNAPAAPTKDGYNFDYWMDNDGQEVKFPVSIIEGNTAYSAKFTAIDYTVTFTVDGKSENAPAALTGKHIGDTITLPAFPTATGTEFAGWYYDGNIYAPNNTFVMPAKSITFNAVSSAKTYTVSFNTNGGNYIASEDHAYNEEIKSFPTPIREGYKFTGWAYGDAGAVSYPFVMPAKSITLHALWELLPADTFEVSYAYMGTVPTGVPALPASANYKKGDTVTVAAAPVLDGYDFDGWYYNNTKYEGGKTFAMPEASVQLTGKWTPHEYSLVLNANGGVFEDKTNVKNYTYTTGQSINAPKNPTRDGYDFNGWMDTSNNMIYQTLPATMPASSKTYVALWTASDLTVTYYLVIGATTPVATQSYKVGDTIVPATLPEGYLADGWVDEDGNALPEKMGTKILVVYPKDLSTREYKLTFDANGGYFDDDTSKTMIESDVKYLAEVKAPTAPKRDGYNFAGWEPNLSATMPNSDTTYKAKWSIIPVDPDTYTATFISDGEVFELYNVEVGEAIPDPGTPKKFGYTFAGWDPEVPSTMPENNVEFVAKWEKDDNFLPIVIGGTVIAGGTIAAIAGINTAIITGAAIVGGIIVIGAVAKNTYTVTYIVDGETYKTYKVVAGTKIPVPDDPAKDGFVFDGWDSEIPSKMPKEDLTFTATWKAETDTEIPDTGSVSAGIAAFAVISSAAAAAYVITKKKKED